MANCLTGTQFQFEDTDAECAGPEQGGEFVSSVFNLCLEISDTALYSCI